MDKDQLRQLILEAYSARKEIRNYFEYFLSPDPEALFDKFAGELAKECSRGKRSCSRARISVIRRLISDFSSYQPGEELVLKFRLEAIRLLLAASAAVRMTDTLTRGFAKLVADYIAEADKAGAVTEAFAEIRVLSDSRPSSSTLRRILHQALV